MEATKGGDIFHLARVLVGGFRAVDVVSYLDPIASLEVVELGSVVIHKFELREVRLKLLASVLVEATLFQDDNSLIERSTAFGGDALGLPDKLNRS